MDSSQSSCFTRYNMKLYIFCKLHLHVYLDLYSDNDCTRCTPIRHKMETINIKITQICYFPCATSVALARLGIGLSWYLLWHQDISSRSLGAVSEWGLSKSDLFVHGCLIQYRRYLGNLGAGSAVLVSLPAGPVHSALWCSRCFCGFSHSKH